MLCFGSVDSNALGSTLDALGSCRVLSLCEQLLALVPTPAQLQQNEGSAGKGVGRCKEISKWNQKSKSISLRVVLMYCQAAARASLSRRKIVAGRINGKFERR